MRKHSPPRDPAPPPAAHAAHAARDHALHLDAVVHHVASFLSMRLLARAAAVCRVWRAGALHARLWLPFLDRRWRHTLPRFDRRRADAREARPRLAYRRCLRAERRCLDDGRVFAPTRVLMDSANTPLCMQFDGDVLISGHIDKTALVWDLGDPGRTAPTRVIAGHSSWVKCLQFDARVLITGSYDSVLREWDRTDEYRLVRTYRGHGDNGVLMERSPRGSVVCLQFDDRKILSGSNDTTVRVWDRDTGQCTRVLDGHARTVRCLAFRDRWCFSGGSDRSVLVHDLETGEVVQQFRGHAHRVSCLQMHRTNPALVISGSNDRSARMWDTRAGGTCVAIVAQHVEAIRRLRFDDVKLITGGDDDVLRAWDMRMATSTAPPTQQGDGAGAPSPFSAAPSLGAPGSGVCWQPPSGHEERPWRGHPACQFDAITPRARARVSALQFDATRIVASFTLGTTQGGTHVRRGAIKIWDLAGDIAESEMLTATPGGAHK